MLPADLHYAEEMKWLYPLHVPAACRVLDLSSEVPLHELNYISMLSRLTSLTLEMQHSDYCKASQFPPNFSVEPYIGHDAFMASLTCLSKLQVLHLKRLEASAAAMGVIARLSSLRHVDILHVFPIPCYFQQCTQLTHLALSSHVDGWTPFEVWLPLARPHHVDNLARVVLTKQHIGNMEPKAQSAHDAVSLRVETRRFMNTSEPANWLPAWACLGDHWSPLVGNLRKLGMDCLPSEWPLFSHLTSVCLHKVEADDLPVWFSQLKQLKLLKLMYSSFPVLPVSLYVLDGLHTLILSEVAYEVTQDISRLADLPHLTKLCLGMRSETTRLMGRGKTTSSTEMQCLQQLEVACLAREVPLRRMRSGCCPWDFSSQPSVYY